MASYLEMSMKDFRDISKREEEYLREWEKERIIKKCHECGQPYSYEKGESDPKQCQRCRGEEGELIL
jgi:Zn finger protein HypA/HybF involved in hydrogenase expression